MAGGGERAKRVLFLNQFFWPDAAPTAGLLEDVARKFAAEGWDVTVVCGQGAYAAIEGDQSPPVRIITVPALPYSRKAAGRLLSWCSYLALGTARSLVAERFDLVVAMTSPPGIGWAGALHKFFRASAFWIWEMDVYPDIALALNGSRDSLFSQVASNVFRLMRRSADGILVLGPCMRKRLESHKLNPERLHIAENWAHGDAFCPSPVPATLPLNVLYSGNLGLAHDSDTIVGVLRRFAGSSDVSFLFSGGGVRRAGIEALCAAEKIGNVRFQQYATAAEFRQNLAACHVGLVTLRLECIGSVVPSKVYSFLAAGRPFIYIGPRDATPAIIANEGCGWAFDNGDVEGIARLLCELSRDPSKIQDAGERARHCFDRSYNPQAGTARIFELTTS